MKLLKREMTLKINSIQIKSYKMAKNQVEINNLLEEIQDNLQECIKCGNCKSLCPVFKILREEYYSPRGHTIMLSNKIVEKFVWECCLCKACEEKCPFNLKICESIRKAREILNLKNKELKQNKVCIYCQEGM